MENGRKIKWAEPFLNLVMLGILFIPMYEIMGENDFVKEIITRMFQMQYNLYVLALILLLIYVIVGFIPLKITKEKKSIINMTFTLVISAILLIVMFNVPTQFISYILIYIVVFVLINILVILIYLNKVNLKSQMSKITNKSKEIDKNNMKKVIIILVSILIILIGSIFGYNLYNSHQNKKFVEKYNTQIDDYNKLCLQVNEDSSKLDKSINSLSNFEEVDTFEFEGTQCENEQEHFITENNVGYDYIKEDYQKINAMYEELKTTDKEIKDQIKKTDSRLNEVIKNKEVIDVDKIEEKSTGKVDTYVKGKWENDNTKITGKKFNGIWYDSSINEISAYYTIETTTKFDWQDETDVYNKVISVDYPVVEYEGKYYINGEPDFENHFTEKYDTVVSQNMENSERFKELK